MPIVQELLERDSNLLSRDLSPRAISRAGQYLRKKEEKFRIRRKKQAPRMRKDKASSSALLVGKENDGSPTNTHHRPGSFHHPPFKHICLLYTSDVAKEKNFVHYCGP